MDASEMYSMAVKKVTCHTQRDYKFIKHEASLMQAMLQAGVECVPQLYEFHWMREERAAYFIMQ